MAKSKAYIERIAAQEKYLMALEEFGDRQRACAFSERSYRTVKVWRERYPEFRRREQAIIDTVAERTRLKVAAQLGEGVGESPKLSALGVPEWTYGFSRFRKRFFDMDTPLFQAEMVERYESVRPGNIDMTLVPPEHGKTTLFEDFASMKLAVDPNYRITVGSEKQGMSTKILRRVMNRMSPNGPFTGFVEYWGPMSPEDDRNANKTQIWTQQYFDVTRKRSHDERDYSMQALGIGSQVAGTRTDHLHVDDIQSLNNISQTKKIVETYRQDWLSRPGETGRSTINGTRVEEGDFYEVLEEEIPPDILTIVRKPAIVWDSVLDQKVPLWPEKFTMEGLDRIRAKVGESAWNRNYMQAPLASATRVFDNLMLEGAHDELVDVYEHELEMNDRFVVTCDPSIGGRNVWMVFQITDRWIMPIWIEVNHNLSNYDQIFSVLGRLLQRYCSRGAICAAVVIEAMAFQRGLLEDRRLIELQAVYGFETVPHTTGRNKADPSIGVPAIPGSFRRHEIRIPWGGDDTKDMMRMFEEEALRWRPGSKFRGTDLVQDIMMAFWFGWLWWSTNRQIITVIRHEVSPEPYRDGLPFGSTPYPAATPMPSFVRS